MPDNPFIELREVRFAWRDGPSVIDVPELRIDRGQRIFLYGPSGSGKSTLLGLLGGVHRPQSGSIRILGQDLVAMKGARRDRFRADHIGFVFQQFNLVPYLSILDNVLLPLSFSKTRRQRLNARASEPLPEARRLLDHLGLPKALQHRPVTDLSIGQQQRVAVARALIGSPDLLIADEPTSALDSDSREAFLKLLFEECEREGTTLVFVSHDQSLKPLFGTSLALDAVNRASGPR